MSQFSLNVGIGIVVLVILSVLTYLFLMPTTTLVPEVTTPTTTPEVVVSTFTRTDTVIGTSVEGREIAATTFGTGETELLFVGGIHGGYEWNSSLLAYEFIDYIVANPTLIPEDLTVTIIPVLNPDGLAAVVGSAGPFLATDVPDPTIRVPSARFNANQVDLNRNFGCRWAPISTWRGAEVSAGSAAFSEPEAVALRDYVLGSKPSAVVFWHSQANNVYASECEDGVLSETLSLMNTYATAGSYGAVPVFDAYPITGDAEGWLASVGIPAVTVELETYHSIEWTRNLAGIKAVLEEYSIAK